MRVAKREVLLLVLILAAGAGLRLYGLAAPRLNVDVGAYFLSAELDALERGGSPLAWVGDDARWLLSEKTFPHCFLHQLAMRWLHRAGASAPITARATIALFGTLAAAAAWLLHRTAVRDRRGPPEGEDDGERRPSSAPLWTAALVAVSLLPVHYSRVVWGEMAATTFWLAWLAVLWVAFERAGVGDHGRLLRLGLAGAALLLLGYGMQEFVVVYAVAAGAWVLLRALAWRGAEEPGLFASPRAWTWALSALPVLCVGAAALLYSDELVRMQFDVSVAEPYWPYRMRLLQALFQIQQVHVQLGLPLVAASALGALVLLARDRALAALVLGNGIAAPLLLLLLFRDSALVRLYLPVVVLLALCAGEAVAWLADLVRGAGESPLRARLALAPGLALVLWQAAVTWRTEQGEPGDALFVARVHAVADARAEQEPWPGLPGRLLAAIPGLPLPDLPPRRDPRPQREQDRDVVVARGLEEPLVAALEELRRPGETVAVFGDFTPVFFLRDRGFATEPKNLDLGPREEWPRLLIAVKRLVPGRGWLAEEGGDYAEVAADRLERFAVYRRAEPGER